MEIIQNLAYYHMEITIPLWLFDRTIFTELLSFFTQNIAPTILYAQFILRFKRKLNGIFLKS
jgi:hypothetical protein